MQRINTIVNLFQMQCLFSCMYLYIYKLKNISVMFRNYFKVGIKWVIRMNSFTQASGISKHNDFLSIPRQQYYNHI